MGKCCQNITGGLMKIAIVAPSPTPFTMGGAEKLWFGIEEYLNKNTNHQCELIKIPTKEGSFWDLIDAYYSFYNLDLSHFDMVISGKYPAWMTPHHNHHIYMLHTLRGLYDSYNSTMELPQIENIHIKNIMEYMQRDNATIQTAFDMIFNLKKEKNIPQAFFDFPAPFIKEIIHFLDKKAMQHIKKFSAISQTVANRKSYFPNLAKVKVIYPPSNLTDFQNSGYHYFFTASRLDAPKRIDMLIKAYQKADTNIPLKIAGTGAQYNHLKALIGEDKNIELLGFVSDIELKAYYANAYAIIFIPKEEDYGLITIEAMSSQKAVITCSDSGGVLEFVQHNKTGIIASPSIEELSRHISFISTNRELTIKMGENAQKSVSHIQWENTINELIPPSIKLTIVSTYSIYPPMGGGKNRVFYLYKALAKYFDITIISLVDIKVAYSKKEIAPNLYEIQVPMSHLHDKEEQILYHSVGKIPITDIALIELYHLTPQFIEEVKQSSQNATFVVMTSPYPYPMLKEHIQKPIIYESQNVEYLLKKQILNPSPFNNRLLKKLFQVEKDAFLNAQIVTVCAKEDRDNFRKLYQERDNAIPFIANGVDLATVRYHSKATKKRKKEKSKYKDKRVALFIGSYHQPNIDAVYEIIKMAKQDREMIFIIMGGVFVAFEEIETPQNIEFTRFVDDVEKDYYLSITDIALNPMLSGSGSNLKMLDYIASGIPTITTPIGARGLNLPKGTVVEANIEDFLNYFENIEYLVDTKRAKRFVQKEYSWQNIAQKFKKELLQYAKN